MAPMALTGTSEAIQSASWTKYLVNPAPIKYNKCTGTKDIECIWKIPIDEVSEQVNKSLNPQLILNFYDSEMLNVMKSTLTKSQTFMRGIAVKRCPYYFKMFLEIFQIKIE